MTLGITATLTRPNVAGFKLFSLVNVSILSGATVQLSRFILIIIIIITARGHICLFVLSCFLSSLPLSLHPPSFLQSIPSPLNLYRCVSVYLCSTPHLYVWNKARGQCYNLEYCCFYWPFLFYFCFTCWWLTETRSARGKEKRTRKKGTYTYAD